MWRRRWAPSGGSPTRAQAACTIIFRAEAVTGPCGAGATIRRNSPRCWPPGRPHRTYSANACPVHVADDGSLAQPTFTGQIPAKLIQQLVADTAHRCGFRWHDTDTAQVSQQRNHPPGRPRKPVPLPTIAAEELLQPLRSKHSGLHARRVQPPAQLRHQQQMSRRRRRRVPPRRKLRPEPRRIAGQRPRHPNTRGSVHNDLLSRSPQREKPPAEPGTMPTTTWPTPSLTRPNHNHPRPTRHNPALGIVVNMPRAAYLRADRRQAPHSVHRGHLKPRARRMADHDDQPTPRPIRRRPARLHRPRTRHRRRLLPTPPKTHTRHQNRHQHRRVS